MKDSKGQGSIDLTERVAALLAQWEQSDELTGEFAERLVAFVQKETLVNQC